MLGCGRTSGDETASGDETTAVTISGSRSLQSLDLDALRHAAEAAVSEAGEAILAVVRRGSIRVASKGHKGPVSEADHAADAILSRRLLPLIEGAQWVSEESEQIAPLQHGAPTWVVDPLDGTREFLRGLPEYGVSVALFVGDELVMGVVAIPATGDVLSAIVTPDRQEAHRNGERLPRLDATAPLTRVVVSRHDYEWTTMAETLPYKSYPCGSAAVKLVHVAQGRAQLYIASGPRSVWDMAGGAALVRAVGGTQITFRGDPLVLRPGKVRVPANVAGLGRHAVEFFQKMEPLWRLPE